MILNTHFGVGEHVFVPISLATEIYKNQLFSFTDNYTSMKKSVSRNLVFLKTNRCCLIIITHTKTLSFRINIKT